MRPTMLKMLRSGRPETKSRIGEPLRCVRLPSCRSCFSAFFFWLAAAACTATAAPVAAAAKATETLRHADADETIRHGHDGLSHLAHSAEALLQQVANHDESVAKRADLSQHRAATAVSKWTWLAILILLGSMLLACFVLYFLRAQKAASEPMGEEEQESQRSELEKEREAIRSQIRELEGRIEAARHATAATAKASAKDAAAGAAEAQEGEMPSAADAAEEDRLKLETAAQSLEEQTSATLESMRQQTEQALEKAEEIHKRMLLSASEAWKSAEVFVKETGSKLTAEVQQSVTSEPDQEEISAWEATAKDVTSSMLALPLPLLVAGCAAPFQLQLLSAWNWLLLMAQLPVFFVVLMGILVDIGKPCGTGTLWVWIVGMAGILAKVCCLRLYVVLSAERTMREVRTEKMPDTGLAESMGTLGTLWSKLTKSSKDYFKALVAYDGLARSMTYVLLNVLSFAAFVWGGVGLYLSIWHVVQDDTDCKAGTMRFVAHMYAFFYVMLMIWSLVAVVLWLGGLALTSESASLVLLRRAVYFDENFSPAGFQVVTLMVRALLLRGTQDTAQLEACILRSEIDELSQEQQDLKKQEELLSKELAAAETQLAAVTKQVEAWQSPDELATKYTERLKDVVDKAAIVGLAVSRQVQAHAPSVQAQLQAKSESLAEAASQAGAKALAQTQETVTKAVAEAQHRAEEAGFGDAKQLQERAAELAEVARRRAEEAGLGDVSQLQGRATELAEAAQRRAQEAAQQAGLPVDVTDLRQSLQNLGADSLQELAYASLLRAQAMGLDVEDMVRQAMGTEGAPAQDEQTSA